MILVPPSPPLFVVVDVVHATFSLHDASHLVQEDPVVSLHHSTSLLLHLQLLQVEVEVHVRLRRFIVNHRTSVTHLMCRESRGESSEL